MPDAHAVDQGYVLATLYATRYRALVGLAALLLRDLTSCEDVVQEAFIQLHLAWPRLRDTQKADAYIRQTVVNLSRSRLRRLAVARRHAPWPAADAPSAEEGAYAALERDELVAAVRRLPPRQREAVALRVWADMTQEASAQAMGVSVGSAKAYLSRGMAALAQDLRSRQ